MSVKIYTDTIDRFVATNVVNIIYATVIRIFFIAVVVVVYVTDVINKIFCVKAFVAAFIKVFGAASLKSIIKNPPF